MQKPERKEGAPVRSRGWIWIAGGAALLAVVLAAALLRTGGNKADYVISWVGTGPLSEEATAAIEAAVARGGADQNGDGEIRTEIRQFSVDFSLAPGDTGYEESRAALEELLDQTGTCGLYLLEDPEGFQTATGALARLDGTVLEEDQPIGWERMCVFWHPEGLEREVYLGRGIALGGEEGAQKFPGAGILFDALTDGC